MFDEIYYKNLNKPAITPPNYVFRYVWYLLYILMFFALTIVIFSPNSMVKFFGILFFILQLVLNIIWAPVFFKLRKMKLSLIICIFLTVFALVSLYFFSKVSLFAFFLMFPYILWLFFACFLLANIVSMNN